MRSQAAAASFSPFLFASLFCFPASPRRRFSVLPLLFPLSFLPSPAISCLLLPSPSFSFPRLPPSPSRPSPLPARNGGQRRQGRRQVSSRPPKRRRCGRKVTGTTRAAGAIEPPGYPSAAAAPYRNSGWAIPRFLSPRRLPGRGCRGARRQRARLPPGAAPGGRIPPRQRRPALLIPAQRAPKFPGFSAVRMNAADREAAPLPAGRVPKALRPSATAPIESPGKGRRLLPALQGETRAGSGSPPAIHGAAASPFRGAKCRRNRRAVSGQGRLACPLSA